MADRTWTLCCGEKWSPLIIGQRTPPGPGPQLLTDALVYLANVSRQTVSGCAICQQFFRIKTLHHLRFESNSGRYKHQHVYLHSQMHRIDFTKAILKRYQKDTKTSSPHDVHSAPHNNTLSKATTRTAEHFLLGLPSTPFLKPWIHGKFTKETVTTRILFLLGYPNLNLHLPRLHPGRGGGSPIYGSWDPRAPIDFAKLPCRIRPWRKATVPLSPLLHPNWPRPHLLSYHAGSPQAKNGHIVTYRATLPKESDKWSQWVRRPNKLDMNWAFIFDCVLLFCNQKWEWKTLSVCCHLLLDVIHGS